MTLPTPTVVLFWTCLAAVCYAYVGYPVLIWALARLFGRRGDGPHVPRPEELPTLSVLIAAYNEEAVLEERIRNALALVYPAGKFEIVVASDGSSDGTASIVRRFQGRGVRLLDYHPRRGKSSVLNRAFRELRGEVVLLSDANTHTDPDAALRLARWFREPDIGVVCGRLVLTDPATGRNVDGMYWRYETFLKCCEGRLGALLGVNGAIYAMRRELFMPIPEQTLIDDVILPLRTRMRTGCGLVYDRTAIAREETAPDVRGEFNRRVRFGAGGYQAMAMLWPLLDPRRGWIALSFFSHKVLRWLCPFALLCVAASNLALAGRPFYRELLALQAGFYLVAWGASYLPGQSRPARLLRLTTMFTSMNAALMVGFFRWLSNGQKAAWRRTARTAELGAALAPSAVVAAGPPFELAAKAGDTSDDLRGLTIAIAPEAFRTDDRDQFPDGLAAAVPAES
jgi:cellulose synthase/poly-beta-1,6-N-acetylglucosamine synthase-like glycosyltransferase